MTPGAAVDNGCGQHFARSFEGETERFTSMARSLANVRLPPMLMRPMDAPGASVAPLARPRRQRSFPRREGLRRIEHDWTEPLVPLMVTGVA